MVFCLSVTNLFSLTQDIELNIASGSPLEIEYVLAKGICKMLSREHDVSKFMGGVNSLNCNVLITDGTKQNLEFIQLNKVNYAIIDLNKILSNYNISSLASLIFLKGPNKNWALVTSAQEEKQEICEVTEAVFKNSLELKYLHSDFRDFSHETFIIKKNIPIHMGSFKYFETRECQFRNNIMGEL
ncbi:MAG: hypothetical protein O3C61_02135 [Proteobacteria bacterium]|nr:hypothetical protein [Pseudomonadota bacterium]